MRLGLLGHPELLCATAPTDGIPPRESGQPIRLQPLALAVLAYLHVEGPQERDHLAQLFWPNSSGGLNALSTTLSRVRADASEAIWTQGRDLVGCDLPSDYDDLTRAAAAGDAEVLRELSGNAFLQTLNLRRFGLEFEEWLLGVRSVLDSRVEAGLMRCAVDCHDAGDTNGAADLAEAAFVVAERRGVPAIDLLPTYFELLAAAGRGLVIDVRAAADEFGVQLPDAGTVAVARSAARDARAEHDPSDTQPQAAAPVDGQVAATSPTTQTAAVAGTDPQRQSPFVGCEDELAALAESVAENPVTSIVGLGGSGKSRLMNEFGSSVRTAATFDQIIRVDLVGVSDSGLMAATIADAIGQPMRPGQPLITLFTPEAPTLLLIDNSEVVVDLADELADLTVGCPGLRVVLARRLPLGIKAEPIIAMTGLDVDVVAGSSPARALFASAAHRARGVALGPDEQADVDRVCRLVGGLPLALELAGAWVGLLRVGSVAEALESDIDVLDGSLPVQERSMASVLEFAWNSLDQQEQRAVMALSMFAGGAPIDALSSLRRVNLRTVGGLVRKALVTVTADDRFDVHALVRSIASQRLAEAPEVAEEHQRAHAQWCVDKVHTLGTELDGPNQSDALGGLTAELQNIAATWRWAADTGRSDILTVMLAPLREYLIKSAKFTRAERFFEIGLERFDADVGADEPREQTDVRLHAELTDALAWVSLVTGRTGRAVELSARALRIAPDHGAATASILRTQAMIAFGQSDMAEAEKKVTAALALLDPTETSRLSAKLHEDMGHCHRFRGDVDAARQAYRSTLDNGRLLGDPHMLARSCLTLGELERTEAPQRGRVLLDQGFEIAQDNQLDHLATYFPGALGKTWLVLGEYAQARDSFAQGVELATEAGVVITVAANHLGLAQAHHHLGEPSAAHREAALGLRRSVEGDCWPYLLEGLVTTAMLAMESPPVPGSVIELLRVGLHHPATEPETRVLAQTLAAEISAAGGAPDGFDPPEGLAAMRLDELAEDALAVTSHVG